MGGDLEEHLADGAMEELKNFHVSIHDELDEIVDVMGEEEEDDSGSTDGEDGTDVIVFLGFPEKPKNHWSLHRQLFPSKAGGVPAWLDPENLPSGRSSLCGFCGDPLRFMLQVYCPIPDEESTFHRTLFMFMCPSMSCLLRDQHEQWKRQQLGVASRSVKIFRCQLPLYNDFYSSDPPKYDGSDRPSTVAAKLCTWCGTWRGNRLCSNCKEVYYCSDAHQVLHWNASHKTHCRQLVTSSLLRSDGTVLGKAKKECWPTLWPEYEIVEEEESHQEKEISTNKYSELSMDNHKGGGCANTLLQTFNHGDGDGGGGGDDDDKNSWASFQTRVGRAPRQVLRYCRDKRGKPLWPAASGKPSEGDIPKCGLCGGPRAFEFQVLPQLLYYFGVKNEERSLDWSTLCAYTCLHSCHHSSRGYMEEFAWVQISPS